MKKNKKNVITREITFVSETAPKPGYHIYIEGKIPKTLYLIEILCSKIGTIKTENISIFPSGPFYGTNNGELGVYVQLARQNNYNKLIKEYKNIFIPDRWIKQYQKEKILDKQFEVLIKLTATTSLLTRE